MTVLRHRPASALAIFAHPDDPEVACAGTLAGWVEAGARCHHLIANQGEKGSDDLDVDPAALARRRTAEAAAAAEALGLAGMEHLDVPDGELDNTSELRGQLVAVIRRLRPEVVIAPDPTAVFFGGGYINHRDHRELGWAVLDACAPMSASPHYYPDAGPPHQVRELLLAGTLAPDAWVDVEATLEVKTAALGCHRSQLGDGLDVLGDLVASRAAEAAAASGQRSLRYAEGFRRIVLG